MSIRAILHSLFSFSFVCLLFLSFFLFQGVAAASADTEVLTLIGNGEEASGVRGESEDVFTHCVECYQDPCPEGYDECGVCGGSGKDECGNCEDDERKVLKDCAGVCGGSHVVDSCGVCGGDGRSCGEDSDGSETGSCVWVAAWANWNTFDMNVRDDNLLELFDNDSYSHREEVPSCFSARFQSHCIPVSVDASHASSVKGYGFCKSGTGFDDHSFSLKDFADFLGVPHNKRDGFVVPPTFEESAFENFTLGKSWFMDANCRFVEPRANTEVCGFAGVSWSPVSLIWEEGASLEEDMTVVNFSLNAKQPNAHSLWKASAKAPLLVHDPENTGDVTSATQLFGHFAFGGDTRKVSYRMEQGLSTYWNNGYEAMGLLDTNRDGKLSGSELDDIALWFDADRDADVDPEELRSIRSQGVSALFFKGYKKVPGSNDLALDIGFERVVEGKRVRGRSVDWFSETYSSRMEALQALNAIFENGGSLAGRTSVTYEAPENIVRVANWPDNPMAFSPHQAVEHKKDLSGYWVWHVEESGGKGYPGAFAFEQTSDGIVRGFNAIESRLEKNTEKLQAAMIIKPTKGFVSYDRGGRVQLTMNIDAADGVSAKSEATLSRDGTRLHGQTTQYFSVEKRGLKKSATISYTWVAYRY